MPLPFPLPLLLLPLLLLHPITPITATAKEPPPPSCPQVLSPPTQRIIDGTRATPTTVSHLASLSYPNNTFACTGTLLSPRWILTAAHCDVTPFWLVRVSKCCPTRSVLLPILRVFTHDSYRPGVFDAPGDLALIHLTIAAPSFVSFVTINVNQSAPVSGAFARAAGFGRTHISDQPQHRSQTRNLRARQVDVPINNPIKCEKTYAKTLAIHKNHFICAGYSPQTPGIDCMGAPCKGDSGGPLYQFDALGNVVLIGVVSFGMNCGSAGVPGVYVRISHFISWLRRLNVPFRTGDPVVSYFDTGSREAASETPAVVGGELTVNDGNIVVSKVWFVVICVIAGIAVIALIFISLLFVSGFGSSGRRGEEVQEGDVDRDSLHAAISILQGLVEEHSSRDGADTIHDGEYDGEQSRANVVEENRNV